MKYGPLLLFLIAAFGFIGGCGEKLVFPPEPQIEFLSIEPETVKSFPALDTIYVRFRFQDGDGDLGNLNDNDPNFYLFLIDARYKQGLVSKEQATTPLRIPNLTPNARRPSIQGVLTAQIPGTIILTPGANEEITYYEIELYDRAGNKATRIEGTGNPDEPIVTTPITITRN